MLTTLLCVILLATGWLWTRGEWARHARAEDAARCDALRRLIARDPQNIGAHEALGDALLAAGREDEAEQAYHGALEAGADRFLDGSARAKLRGIDRERRARVEGRQPLHSPRNEPYLCRRCGAPNPPSDRACAMCGEAIAYDSFLDALRDRGVRQAVLESVIMLCVVLLCLNVFARLPVLVQGTVVVAAVWVILWRLLRAIEGRRG